MGRRENYINKKRTMRIDLKWGTNLVYNQVRATAYYYPKLQMWLNWAPSVNASITDHIRHADGEDMNAIMGFDLVATQESLALQQPELPRSRDIVVLNEVGSCRYTYHEKRKGKMLVTDWTPHVSD